jgi:hypothetical protein
MNSMKSVPVVELLQPLQLRARGGERAVGVVGHLDRRSEDGHDPVAHVVDERAAVGNDRVVDHRGQVAVEDADHLIGFELLCE